MEKRESYAECAKEWHHKDRGLYSSKLPLVVLLEEFARRTWHQLRVGKRLGVSIGEETITDLIALDLAMFAEERVGSTYTLKIPKGMEGEAGLDLYWMIGGDNVGWYSMALQAKRADLDKSARYPGFSKRVPGSGKLQLVALEQFARLRRAWPGYLLYNVVERTDEVLLGSWHCVGESLDPEQLGCTVAPSSVVRNALKTRHAQPSTRAFDSVHSESSVRPLRCICCPRTMPRLYGEDAFSDPEGLGISDGHFHQELPPEFEALSHRESPETVFRLLKSELSKARRALIDHQGGSELPRVVVLTDVGDSPSLMV